MTSIVAAIFITGLKLIVGLMTNSLGILSEAAHSGLDLIAAVMTYFAVSIADRPPDKEHQYGHTKAENLSAFLETLLLVLTCVWIISEAISRLIGKTTDVEANVWSFTVVIVAIIVDISRSRALKRMADKHNSQALEADALHFASDVWSSLVVLGGLVLVSFGYIWVDAIAAIAVAILVLVVSFRLGRRTVDALMERVPEGLSERILSVIRGIDGVEEIRSIRLRPSGSKVFVDAVVAVKRTTAFQDVHIVMDKIEDAVHTVNPDADVVVHAEPQETSDETIADKIRMIVLGKGLRMPHNLEVHHTAGRYHVDFDVEYTKGRSFVEAHDLASAIEEDIKETVPDVEKVTIHMEELEHSEDQAIEATGKRKKLKESIRRSVLSDSRLERCSDLTLLKVGDKYNLSLSCVIDKRKTLGEVHQIVSEVESKLYEKFPMLRRITVHAEPAN
jgi:cation diffusion facilitator family transporter